MRPRRPGSVTAFGVLNIVLGILLLFCGLIPLTTTNEKLTINNKDVTQEFKDYMDKDIPGYAAYRVASPVTMLALGVGFILSGVGLVLVKGWGRVLALTCAGVCILHRVFVTIYEIALVNPTIKKFFPSGPIDLGGVATGVKAVLLVMFALVVVGYSIALFIGMLGSRTRRVFSGEYDPDEDRDDRRSRRRYEDDDDEDDRPRGRSRRRDDDDDEDDRPRRSPRRPARDEEDIPDAPRRRRPSRRDEDDD